MYGKLQNSPYHMVDGLHKTGNATRDEINIYEEKGKTGISVTAGKKGKGPDSDIVVSRVTRQRCGALHS